MRAAIILALALLATPGFASPRYGMICTNGELRPVYVMLNADGEDVFAAYIPASDPERGPGREWIMGPQPLRFSAHAVLRWRVSFTMDGKSVPDLWIACAFRVVGGSKVKREGEP